VARIGGPKLTPFTIMTLTPEVSVDAFLDTPRIKCFLTYQPLDVQSIIASVQDVSAGAIATFIGS
jgi:molybdopterin synthase catalytic subunit